MLLLLLGACRFQDRTPGSSRRDEAAVQGVVTQFYQAVGSKDRAGLLRSALPSATALFATEGGSPVLGPLLTVVEVPDRRNQGGGARVVRSDLHTDGDVASDRIVIVARSADGLGEFEATDVLTLAHRDGGWRIAQAMFGPWKLRSAP
jgi:hypothetical protein